MGAFAIVALIIVALFGLDTITSGIVRSYVRTIGTIAWSTAVSAVTAIDSSGVLASRQSLIRENDALKEQLSLLQEHSARFKELEADNARLQELAHLVARDPGGIAVRMLSSFQASPYGTFLIGSGKNAGITIGSVVLTPGGYLLGTISDVDSETASVKALLSPGENIDLIANEVAFSAQGYGGGNARGEMPRTALIAVGDAVTSPKHYNRIVGIIGAIESASSSASQKVFMRLPTNLATLRYVYIIPAQQ